MKDIEKKELKDEQTEQVSGGRITPKRPFSVGGTIEKTGFKTTVKEKRPGTKDGGIYSEGMIDTQY